MSRPLVLASASPRRRELLQQIGLDFTVAVSQVVESAYDATSPGKLVMELAQAKAEWIQSGPAGAVIIGADTVVVVDEHILGKPADEEDAVSMLRLLRGREHQVYSGVAVVDTQSGLKIREYEMTRVFMREYADDEISHYVATGEPFDKAGSYAIQGRGALLIRGIEGCYTNVVGLPLARLGQMLKKVGIPLY